MGPKQLLEAHELRNTVPANTKTAIISGYRMSDISKAHGTKQALKQHGCREEGQGCRNKVDAARGNAECAKAGTDE